MTVGLQTRTTNKTSHASSNRVTIIVLADNGFNKYNNIALSIE